MGAWIRVDADGRVVRDDPRTLACLPDGGIGATALAVGIIEGIAEATAAITKVFSGALSDRIGRRKELATIGYGLAAITKPVFPLASGMDALIGARFIDRIGKGIRGAPRDALVADLAQKVGVARPSVFANRSTRSEHSSDRCWPFC